MDFFHYCYNVIFILIFAFTISVCYRVYGLTDRLLFKYSGELLLLYILESIYQGSIEIFGTSYEQFTVFLEAGYDFYIQVLLTAIEACVLGKFVDSMLKKYRGKAPLAAMASVLIIAMCGYFLPGDTGLMLTSNIYGFAMTGLSVYFYISMFRKRSATVHTAHTSDSTEAEEKTPRAADLCKKQEDSSENRAESEAFSFIIGLMAIFGLLVIAENTNYIFGSVSINVVLQFYTKVIRWADDIFSIILSVWLVWYGNVYADRFMTDRLEELLSERLLEFSIAGDNGRTPEKDAEAQRVSTETDERKNKFDEFCRLYALTARESEIAALMLDGKSNKEICDELSLSLGTVKVHVHSILTKLSISRRTQLMSRFNGSFG